MFELHFVANPLNEPPFSSHCVGDKRSSQLLFDVQQAPRAIILQQTLIIIYFEKKLTTCCLITLTIQRPFRF